MPLSIRGISGLASCGVPLEAELLVWVVLICPQALCTSLAKKRLGPKTRHLARSPPFEDQCVAQGAKVARCGGQTYCTGGRGPIDWAHICQE